MNRSVVGFLSFVIALILAITVVWPKAVEVRDLGVIEQAKKSISQSKTDRLKALTEVTTIFDVNTARIERIMSAVPVSPAIPEAIVTIEAIARINSITIQSVIPQLDSQKQQVVMTVIGEGDLSAIEGFVDSLATNNRPVSVTAMTVSKRTEGAKLNFSIGLNFPFLSDGKEKL